MNRCSWAAVVGWIDFLSAYSAFKPIRAFFRAVARVTGTMRVASFFTVTLERSTQQKEESRRGDYHEPRSAWQRVAEGQMHSIEPQQTRRRQHPAPSWPPPSQNHSPADAKRETNAQRPIFRAVMQGVVAFANGEHQDDAEAGEAEEPRDPLDDYGRAVRLRICQERHRRSGSIGWPGRQSGNRLGRMNTLAE